MVPASMKIVSYCRVSTDKQGKSGLGLEGQQAAVADFVRQQNAILVGEYIEVETGKTANRPQLRRAISHAKRSRARLVVAKLDRLARNVAFLATLMESGADFVCVDNPCATRLTLHILAVIAEDEARRISERTTTALAAAKRRGVRLGSARPGHWVGREHQRLAGLAAARHKAAEVHRTASRQAYEDLLPMIVQERSNGRSLREIADVLNGVGHSTRRGKPWRAAQVARVLQLARELPPTTADVCSADPKAGSN